MSEGIENLNALSQQEIGTIRNKNSQPNYEISGGVICQRKNHHGNEFLTPLCNFSARILRQITQDNGLERTSFFDIYGKGETEHEFPVARVAASAFGSMSWVLENWGAQAIVHAGMGARDHLRAAIQTLSDSIKTDTVFIHTGWRKNPSGRWQFLMSGGALSEGGVDDSVKVELPPGNFSHYSLSATLEKNEISEAIRNSMGMLELGPAEICFPCFAAIYRAPLNHIKKPDFSIFLAGASGVFKTELSALLQAHFGKGFSRLSLPENWTSTANALEKNAFLAKDVLFVIDDFAPTGGRADIEVLQRKAERLIRAQGNQAGRGRLSSTCETRAQYYPRCLIVSTGEDVPIGHSLRARLVIVDVKKGEIDIKKLSDAQRCARQGAFQSAMSGYLAWLSPQMDTPAEKMEARFVELRERFSVSLSTAGVHQRTAETLANLYLGFDSFLKFAREKGVLKETDCPRLEQTGFEAFVKLASASSVYLQCADPVQNFLRHLGALLASGRGHLCHAQYQDSPVSDAEAFGWKNEDGTLRPKGPLLGWVSGREVWLIPETCYEEVRRNYPNAVSLSENTLWKRLKERGYTIVPDAEHRNKCRRSIEGRKREVVVLKDSADLIGQSSSEHSDTPSENRGKW